MKVQVTYDDTLYQLVPREPTLDMGWAYLNAANKTMPEKEHSFNHAGYRAMLSAAPTPPAQPINLDEVGEQFNSLGQMTHIAQPANTQSWYGLDGSAVCFGSDLENLKSSYPNVKEWKQFTPSIFVGNSAQPAERKPLTDEQITEIWRKSPPASHDFARAIEAAHGIKGES